MLYLHQYPGIWGLRSLSPFCVKVETYLRMRALPYEVVIENNPRKGPKGKMPVLRDADQVIPDSSFIIEYLENKYPNQSLASISKEDLSSAYAIKMMIEEHLYYIILYSRWIDPSGKDFIDQAFRQFFPKPIAGLALWYIRRQLKKQAWQQGIGRHSKAEIYELGIRDLDAIANIVGEKEFCLGETISHFDATIFAFLVTILLTPLNNPLQQALKKHTNLIAYCERIRQLYFKKMPQLNRK